MHSFISTELDTGNTEINGVVHVLVAQWGERQVTQQGPAVCWEWKWKTSVYIEGVSDAGLEGDVGQEVKQEISWEGVLENEELVILVKITGGARWGGGRGKSI